MQLSDTLGIAIGTGTVGAIVAAGSRADTGPGPALVIAFAGCAGVAAIAALAAVRLPRTLEARATGPSSTT